jgi:hypothetical protein
MRYLISGLIVACGFATLAASQETEGTDAKRLAAERYAATSDMRQMMTEMADAMAGDLPEERRGAFRALMLEYVRIDYLEELMIGSMVKHFSLAELNALADFYGSEVGRSAMSKFGPYMADVMPFIQAEMFRAFQELKAKEAEAKSASGT